MTRYVIVVDDSQWHPEDHENKNFVDEIRSTLEDAYISVEYIDEARDGE